MFRPVSILRFIGSRIRGYRSRPHRNPGIQERIDIFKDDHPEIDKLKLEEQHLESHEDDFFNAGTYHKEHEREAALLKRKIHFKRVQRKYFGGQKNPNLLTWSEKEQIRFLANSDPAKWTPEKLSLSFPASVVIIKKVLKSAWKPKDAEKIKKHDKAVAENWKAIEKGELDLPPALLEHVKQFMSRKESNRIKAYSGTETSLVPERKETPASSEFLDIIRSYKNTSNMENNSSAPPENKTRPEQHADPPSETYVLQDENPAQLKHKYYTLEALREEVKSDISAENESDTSKYFLHTRKSVVYESVIPTELLPGSHNEFGNYKKNIVRKVLCLEDEIPDKIIIPKEKRKPGATYKVKDCYYDENGKFLYRVPGMI